MAATAIVMPEEQVSQTIFESNLIMQHPQQPLQPRIATTDRLSEQGKQHMTSVGEPIKLFVGQLPKDCVEEDVHTFFESYGEIVDLTIIKDKSSGRQKGCAFLTFLENSAAHKCISELNDKVAFPSAVKPLQIKPADPHEKEYKLFVGMLPRSLDESAIARIFSAYGELKEVHVIRGPDKQPKGCAFIKYTNKRAALTAIESTNNRLLDISTRPIVVKFADPLKKNNESSPYVLPVSASSTPSIVTNPPIVQMAYRSPPLPIPDQEYVYFTHGNHVPIQYTQHAIYHGDRTNLGVDWSTSLGMENSNVYVNYGGNSYDTMRPMQNVMQLINTPSSPTESIVRRVADNAEHPSMERPPEGPVGANLFIYHLPRDLTDADLATLFASFGNVISAKVFVDRKTSESKGFGFVSYDKPEAAHDAINMMNGFQIGNKRLKVQHKKA